MKRKVISNVCSFLCGAVLFGSIGVFAGSYVIEPNVYPVKYNGQDVQIEGYNIDGYSYFKLRDIGEKVGFGVDFQNDTILLTSGTTATPVPTVEDNKLTDEEYNSAKIKLDNALADGKKGIEDEVNQKVEYWETQKEKYQSEVSKLERQLSALEEQRSEFAGAVTSAGQTQYDNICSNIEYTEAQITSYEKLVKQAEDSIKSLKEQGETLKTKLQNDYNEALAQLNSKR